MERDTATFGMPIDGRPQLEPKLPADFLGNLGVCLKIGEAVEDLARPENLGKATFDVQKGVKSENDAYLKNFIAPLREEEDVGQVSINCLQFIKTTGLFVTSWNNFGYASLQRGKAFGHCEDFRFPAGGSLNDIAVIFPPLKNGDWAVTLSLEESTMKAFKDDAVRKSIPAWSEG